MGLTGFASVGGVVLGDAATWAAGEQLVDDGQVTNDQVAAAGEAAPIADAAREIPGFSDSFINTILTNANITDSKAQEILDGTDIARDDLTGPAAVVDRVSDDWQDNQFESNRENRATVAAEELAANEFAQNFRPDWIDTADATVNAVGQQLVVDGGSVNGGDARTASVTYPTGILGGVGDWQIEFALSNDIDGMAGANNPCLMMPIFLNNNNCYFIRISTGGPSIQVIRRLNGNNNTQLNTGNISIGTATHTLRFTKALNGDIELFYDGISEDSGNDERMAKFGSTALAGAGADTDVQYNWLRMRPI